MFTVTSGAFGEGQSIPEQYSCDGADLSPPLAWTDAPEGTAAYALVMDDPDAGGFVHWVVADMAADLGALAEGASGSAAMGGAIEGQTSFGLTGYGGPCPPGGTHHYVFTLYALSAPVARDVEPSRLTAAALRQAMDGLVLAEAILTGTYTR
jgi:hypothetical protein